MPKLILPKEAARQVVSSGTKASGKSIQTFKRSTPSEEEAIVLIRISSEWTVLTTGGYRATGVMIGASGNVRSGEVFVYAPTAASADGLPLSGKRIHAARVNGRWEMIQSGSGSSGDDDSLKGVDVIGRQGITVTSDITNPQYPKYTVDNDGVLGVQVRGREAFPLTGVVFLNSSQFQISENTVSLTPTSSDDWALDISGEQVDDCTVAIIFGLTRI